MDDIFSLLYEDTTSADNFSASKAVYKKFQFINILLIKSLNIMITNQSQINNNIPPIFSDIVLTKTAAISKYFLADFLLSKSHQLKCFR